ncbi:uncharacterized protein LOC108042955 [Drosophila rhopaloa]|uniref:Uncharacterized protein LOC108042955 n=1 Tax=Drosophila rhopaloa TaxID=1041015 RepID=A0A6P4EFN0_DRORH|nr:uncharacterized protein LOC108042955 [Drosophila rhopaloa]
MEDTKATESECPIMDTQKILVEIDIPDMVQLLPTFDGDQYTLSDFIGSVEDMVINVVKNIYKTDCPVFILRAIRRKIVGEANRVLIRERTKLNWEEIKKALIDNFADPRNMDTLMDDLREIPSFGLKIYHLYVEISKIRCACFDLLERQEEDLVFRKTQECVFEKRFLHAFISGLRGPLKLSVLRKDPKNIWEANKIAMQLIDDFHWARKQKVNHNKRRIYTNKLFFNSNRGRQNGNNMPEGPK